MKHWLLYVLMVMACTAGGQALADDAAPPAPACACHLGAGKMTMIQGTLLSSGAASHLLLKEADGTTVALEDCPELAQLALVPGPEGMMAQVTGLLEGDSVKIQSLSVLKDGHMQLVLGKAYPVRGRCRHCGCRMQIDSAAQADTVCTMCKCGKSCSDCVR